MAKIKLTKVLREGLKEAVVKQQSFQKMNLYEKLMDEKIQKLKQLMKKDGYNV